jgi:hypothetical protein
MYGNHPHGTKHKRDIARTKRASSGQWRTRDGELHPVTVRRVQVCK